MNLGVVLLAFGLALGAAVVAVPAASADHCQDWHTDWQDECRLVMDPVHCLTDRPPCA